eukprot:TRINITY_DN13559_c0_g1_i5.p1 TRINITY_DN13559_c0_g1~~TRINITY_DN13559_c0_g1_i5.p1  ORF type:complete len:363 (+),score=69.27 TRINITY_DN13559_c0_g1_i5:66-1154(+)
MCIRDRCTGFNTKLRLIMKAPDFHHQSGRKEIHYVSVKDADTEYETKRRLKAKELGDALRRQIAANKLKREEEKKKKLEDDIKEEEKIKCQLKSLERKPPERKIHKPYPPTISNTTESKEHASPTASPIKEDEIPQLNHKEAKKEVKLPKIVVNVAQGEEKHDEQLSRLKKQFKRQDEEFQSVLNKFKNSSKITDTQLLAERELAKLRSYISKGINDMYDSHYKQKPKLSIRPIATRNNTSQHNNLYFTNHYGTAMDTESNIKNLLYKKARNKSTEPNSYTQLLHSKKVSNYKRTAIVTPMKGLRSRVRFEKEKTQYEKLDEIIGELLSDFNIQYTKCEDYMENIIEEIITNAVYLSESKIS